MKNNKSLSQPIFSVVRTQKELESLLLSLENFKKTVAKASRADKVSIIFKQLTSNIATQVQESWQIYQAENTQASAESFIKDIEKLLLKAENVQISLAFQPSQIQAEQICDWLRTKLNKEDIILKISYNPQLVAGCILEHKGKRYDLSVATQISNYVKQ